MTSPALKPDAELLAALAETTTIRLKRSPLPLVTAHAINAYNARYADWTPAIIGSDPQFLARITVSWLRHERTGYDQDGETLIDLVGRKNAHQLLRERVLARIADLWPELAPECTNQLHRKNLY